MLRITAICIALALAAPAATLTLLARAACCCGDGQHKCHCPACEHGRELESGQRFVKTCGSPGAAVAPQAPLLALPPLASRVAGPPRAVPPPFTRQFQQAPLPEVPTPPPIA